MDGSTRTRMTPWVARLLGANTLVYLVFATVLTAPGMAGGLGFEASTSAARPWSFFSFPFLHVGLVHLALTSALLWAFGPGLERRLGGRGLLVYYVYCGIGAALFTLLVSLVYAVPPVLGASAPVLGLAVAWGFEHSDREVALPLLPYPVRAQTLVAGLVAAAGVAAIMAWDPVFHPANLGGAAAGYLFFKVRALASRAPVPAARPSRRVVLAPLRQQEDEPEPEPTVDTTPTQLTSLGGPSAPPRHAPATRRAAAPPPSDGPDEVNRVLDKISAEGLGSLTPQEQRVLEEASRRRRQGPEGTRAP